jgi:uncharacterized surface anchored protein
MKSLSFWFGFAILAALVLATASGCSNASADGEIPTDTPSEVFVESLETTPTPTPQEVAEAAAPEEAAPAAAPEEAAAPVLDGVAPYEPPVQGQGGTCISGFIIDVYHQARGAGWNVTVTSQDGTSQSASAGSDGHFKFETLSGGTWMVELTVPNGWRPFTAASFPVTLSGSGSNCAEVRFKVETLACLEVTKLDLKGRVGIAGWQMTATQGATSLSQVTDWQGQTRFIDLAPGSWTVQEESKTGWAPAAGYSGSQTIQLVSPRTPGACQQMTFVNHQVDGGCIQAIKKDAAGNPLRGWKITLVRDDGTQPSRSQYTDTAGQTTFCNLAQGRWTVQEEVQAGWYAVGPTQQQVELTAPGESKSVTFTNDRLTCVDGHKINQLDQGLFGWTIKAENVATGETKSTVTDGNGYFRFTDLKAGTWKISEELQPGWEAVTPAQLEVQVQVQKPGVCQYVRFKNRTEYACVDVYKKDASDGAGLPGWTITLQPAYGGTPTSGTTDGTGHVRFNGLTPGTYTIAEQMQADWYAVTAQSQQVNLAATGSCQVVTFKNRQGTTIIHPGTCRTWYRVCWGDTLYSISRRYRTTVDALKWANRLTSNTIYAGQKLCIP